MDILNYKGYEGTSELDMDRCVCRGKILFIDDLVTYEADSPKDLQLEFEAAVDDYIETCGELGRVPKKPLKGQFNVRVSPELHKKAVLRAVQDSTNLNSVTIKALENYVSGPASIKNITITINEREEPMETIMVTSSAKTTWGKGESRVHH
jgi:predicted HicB family RNase H-like nuclease